MTGKKPTQVPMRAMGIVRWYHVPYRWWTWCAAGRFLGSNKRLAVLHGLRPDGVVRGHFSDFPLNPEREPTHSMYPSLNHRVRPRDRKKLVVETRIVNNMRSHLSEKEFWQLIGHLSAVGVEKGKIKPGGNLRLPDNWHPRTNFARARDKK